MRINYTKWKTLPVIGSLRVKGSGDAEEGERTANSENRAVCGISDICICT